MISADHYKARPDLVNCGRTLFGNLPTRHQQGDLSLNRGVEVQVSPFHGV